MLLALPMFSQKHRNDVNILGRNRQACGVDYAHKVHMGAGVHTCDRLLLEAVREVKVVSSHGESD